MSDESESAQKATEISEAEVEAVSFNDIRDVMNQVVQLRKLAGKIIDDTYTTTTALRLQYMSRIQAEVPSYVMPPVPKVEEAAQKSAELSELLNKRYKAIEGIRRQIKLLDMLEQKEKCPVAKEIDKI